MGKHMDIQTDGLKIYLFFRNLTLIRGRCPGTNKIQLKNCVKRGKGTDDHLMPVGDWIMNEIVIFCYRLMWRFGDVVEIVKTSD